MEVKLVKPEQIFPGSMLPVDTIGQRLGVSVENFNAICAERNKWIEEAQRWERQYEQAVAEKNRLLNSLEERTEEVEMLRKSNQELAAQLSLRADAMLDKRRLDWIEDHKDVFVANLPALLSFRSYIDDTMLEEEEKRQDRISELRTELASLLREGEEIMAR